MAKFRMVRTEFWDNPMVSEEMTPEILLPLSAYESMLNSNGNL
ncbi:hypothetical protein [Neobacillus niacini]